jgi:hypothetical protein
MTFLDLADELKLLEGRIKSIGAWAKAVSRRDGEIEHSAA